MLGPLFFLIYINDIFEKQVSNPKLFADDKSLFSVIFDKDLSAKNLNGDLNRINNSAFQCQMTFNPDPKKQAQEVLFSCKIQKSSQSSLIFNKNTVTQSLTQKHLGKFLDTKLDFQEHLKGIFSKVNKTIRLIRKLRHILPRSPLLTIFKSFIRPHLDYNSESLNIFKKKLLNFIRTSGSTVFNCHNPRGVKLLTRFNLGLSHLREHKFKHSFRDSLNPICSCGNPIQTPAHFLLHCPNFSNERSTCLNIIGGNFDRNILTRMDSQNTQIVLYDNSHSNNITNTLILNASIDFVIATKRFDASLP